MGLNPPRCIAIPPPRSSRPFCRRATGRHSDEAWTSQSVSECSARLSLLLYPQEILKMMATASSSCTNSGDNDMASKLNPTGRRCACACMCLMTVESAKFRSVLAASSV